MMHGEYNTKNFGRCCGIPFFRAKAALQSVKSTRSQWSRRKQIFRDENLAKA